MDDLDHLSVPIRALVGRDIVAGYEVQVAIRTAEALHAAYAKADQLEAAGFAHLASELRQVADGIEIESPGKRALAYFEMLQRQQSAMAVPNEGTRGITSEQTNSQPALISNGDKRKRGPGRPRKHEKSEQGDS